MSKPKVISIGIIVAVLLIVVYVLVVRKPSTTPQGLLGYGGCSQCLGSQCYQAPCNMDCVPAGNGCTTMKMGGAQIEFTLDTKINDGDYAQFNMGNSNTATAIVERNNAAMKDAGVAIGDKVVSVNDVAAKTDLEFAKLVLKLPKGTKLTVQKTSGERLNKTL